MTAAKLLWWALAAVCGAPLLLASSSGGPLGRTGAFGEAGCDGTGCHRNEPLGAGLGRIIVDVGPYIPGQKQRVNITVLDISARRWGFEMAAREARNPQQRAGNFTVVEDDLFVNVRCVGGSAPPCAGELEYVTQTSLGARDNSPTRFISYRVDWTPPSTDVGPVVFTAAGLGADGDGGTNGDHSYTTTMLSVYGPANLPVLRDNGVRSAASLVPGGPITRESLVTLLGEKLAPPGFSREITRAELIDRRLPTDLNRIGADFLLPGLDPLPAYVLSVSETQMDVETSALPPGFVGPIQVQPVFNRGRGDSEIRGNKVTVRVADVAPFLFTVDGRRVLVAGLTPPAGPPSVGRGGLVPSNRFLNPGDTFVIYGAGGGPARPPLDPGTLVDDMIPLNNPVSVSIGGRLLSVEDILYAGVAPGFAGIQQFTLRIPAGVGNGDQPIVVSVAGLESQPGLVLAMGKPIEFVIR